MVSSPGAWRWRAAGQAPGSQEEQRQVVGRASRERRATARMDGWCMRRLLFCPARKPSAACGNWGRGGGRCTVPPRSLITARRGRGRMDAESRRRVVVAVDDRDRNSNKQTYGQTTLAHCVGSVRPGASVLPVSLWRSVERLRQSTERKTGRQAAAACKLARSPKYSTVGGQDRRSRSRRQGSSCAAPPLHVAHGMYSAICWACALRGRGDRNLELGSPTPFGPSVSTRAQGSRSMAAGIGTCHYCTCTWCSEHEHCSRPLALLVTPVVDTRQAGSPRAKGVRR